MGLKIAYSLDLIKQTKKAKLFFKGSKFWIPNAAIVDMKISSKGYDVVVDSWFETNDLFAEVSLSDLLNDKPPADLSWTTGIDECSFPADLVRIQEEALEFAIKLRRCLVWLWTGCGKTKIGIEIANVLKKHGKINRLYWITPQYERAIGQLEASFERWLNRDIDKKVVSMNWFSYHKDYDIKKSDCVIIDETHRVKNGIIAINESADCKLADNIRISITEAGYVYGLTADSCTNGVLDLFGIFFCLDKNIIIEKGRKAHHYLDLKGDKIKGLKSMLSFLESVSPYIFHRSRLDYDKRYLIENDYKLRLSSRQVGSLNDLYNRTIGFRADKQSLVDVFIRMISCTYRVGGADLKKSKLVELLRSIPEGDQVIVFGFTVNGKYSDISLIREACIDYSIIELHGNRSDEDNALAINLFREGKYRILICSYGCGSELLDFPNANHVILFGHSLNPIHRKQGIGRIDRLVQKKQCHVYNLFIENSVEGYIDNLYKKKVELSYDISNYLKLSPKALNNEFS